MTKIEKMLYGRCKTLERRIDMLELAMKFVGGNWPGNTDVMSYTARLGKKYITSKFKKKGGK